MHDIADYIANRLGDKDRRREWLAPRINDEGNYRSPNVADAGMGAFLAQLVLNVSLKNTASLLSPATLGLALATGAPTSVSMSEIGTGSGYTPQTLQVGSVGAAGTQASNSSSCAFGPFNAGQSISGVAVKDTLGTGGNLYYFGLLSAARTVSSGDSLVIAAGALTISLA